MLIALIGTDGAGKSTQADALTDHLQSLGTPVTRISMWDVLTDRFPEARFITSPRAELRVCISEMRGTARVLFLFWMMATVFEDARRHAEGRIVILDGFWLKHAAVEVVHGVPRSLVEELGAIFPDPDLTFYLDVDPEVALRRKRGKSITPYECGNDPSLSADAFLRHQRAVRLALSDMGEDRDWIRIDADQPESDCSSLIIDRVDALLERI